MNICLIGAILGSSDGRSYILGHPLSALKMIVCNLQCFIFFSYNFFFGFFKTWLLWYTVSFHRFLIFFFLNLRQSHIKTDLLQWQPGFVAFLERFVKISLGSRVMRPLDGAIHPHTLLPPSWFLSGDCRALRLFFSLPRGTWKTWRGLEIPPSISKSCLNSRTWWLVTFCKSMWDSVVNRSFIWAPILSVVIIG